MKKLILLVLFVPAITFAQMKIVLPTDQLNPNMAVPFQVDFERQFQENVSLTVMAGNDLVLKVDNRAAGSITSITARFLAASKNVTFILARDGNEIQREERILNLPVPSAIPEYRARTEYKLGASNVEMIPKGVEFVRSISNNRARFFIKNAASKEHFVNKAIIKLSSTSASQNLIITGSPFWYEPFIGITGEFYSADIEQVISN